MSLANLSFAQPFWLYFLLLIPCGWAWNLYWRKKRQLQHSGLQQFIDKNLLPHLLIKQAPAARSKVGVLYSFLVFFVVVALANPRWSYRDLDAFQPTASMVILLDLSNTMNATDVLPSRIVRARQNIEDLLNLSKGLKIGLIGFAGYPHLISPITDDLQTIKTYIPALDTDLSNVQGNSLHAALRMAADLLAAEPGEQKSILLVSDGNIASTNYAQELQTLTSQNIHVHVIGVGTSAGAPFKSKSGTLHKNQGKIAVSKLNATTLKELAKQGQGVYTEAGHTDFGIKTILAKAENPDHEHIVAGKVRQWNDRYYLFLIPAVAIFIYLMRQRVIYFLIIGLCASFLANNEVYALSLPSMFKNSEQIGQQDYVAGNFKQASEHFKDPYHKGVAFYRNGEFAQAEEQFAQVQRQGVKIPAIYNTGNAQMQQRKWRAAINSYEQVLQLEPDNFAAQHNLEIARKMLEENKDEEEQDDNCECKNKDKQQKQDGKGKNSKNDHAKNDQQQNNQEQNQQQQNAQQEQKKQDKNQQQNQQQDQQQKQQAEQRQAEYSDADAAQEKQQARTLPQQYAAQLAVDDAQVEQLLNRVDSDIKVFLKNKFYVEDVLGAQ